MASEFIWQSPDGATEVHLSLDAVDGILHECMRGMGAVPRRGAEVGGVLLGNVAHVGSRRLVTVETFESVPIEYKHGPSYVFSEGDAELFGETMARLNSAGFPRPVGFFRANTRDEMGLSEEDVRTLAQHFADADSVALLIRPATTKPGMAGFVLPREGRFSVGASPESEFVFRRREIEEALEAQAAPAAPRVPYRPFAMPSQHTEAAPASAMATMPPPAPGVAQPRAPTPAPAPVPEQRVPRPRVRWRWLPLSSIFLVIGVLLGIEATYSFRGAQPDPYDLKLTLSHEGNALTLHWNRNAPAVHAAQRGIVVIEDGNVPKTFSLSASDLQTGTVVYTGPGPSVHFQLRVFPHERDSVTETIDWSQ